MGEGGGATTGRAQAVEAGEEARLRSEAGSQ